ncbi:FAD binding domain-containing protein [Pararhizobium sp.]|uniref:FAD binding domain-containing protein n=1 Tax=Pararhizobium sp. TaxID=1977563 RepID=UPI002722AB30|nr:xanthine dehydrogenase family protein subunit M [Pararhizobium sp.]MDO9418484.1 xanthine dehydrogenase family protein subunit M [Pararhizobium sp.]
MREFSYYRAESIDDAVAALGEIPNAQVLAGGTNLVDLMKYHVMQPGTVIDINRLPLRSIETLEDGSLRIGALVSNADVAYDPRVQQDYPLLASAILAGASPQLRNAATTGGNLLQRTRCYYFYDPSTPCNKREPGSGCSAIGGVNRIHAILGSSQSCIAVHPSDMCVALAALGAVVEVQGPDGCRDIAFADFHRLPGDEPARDNTLKPGELVIAIRLNADHLAANHTYLKLRDRMSYAFALISVAVAMDISDGRIGDIRLALGGVAHKPWRDLAAEKDCTGLVPDQALFGRLADRLLAGATGQGHNDFKIPLARKAIVRALSQAAAATPQIQSIKAVQ